MKSSSGFSTSALVLGIIAIVFSFLPIINNFAFFLGILAIIFGVIGLIRKAGKGKAAAGLITGILAMVITLVMQSAASKALDKASSEFNHSMDNLTGDNTEEILGKDVNVELGTFSATADQYGITKTDLPVTVTNLSSETKSFDIQIECVDADGNRIVDDYVVVNSLAAGQSINESCFEYVESDKLEAVKAGTFRIAEISMY